MYTILKEFIATIFITTFAMSIFLPLHIYSQICIQRPLKGWVILKTGGTLMQIIKLCRKLLWDIINF